MAQNIVPLFAANRRKFVVVVERESGSRDESSRELDDEGSEEGIGGRRYCGRRANAREGNVGGEAGGEFESDDLRILVDGKLVVVGVEVEVVAGPGRGVAVDGIWTYSSIVG